MSLVMWDQAEDDYDHSQQAVNNAKIDNHDHTPGRGVRLTAESIEPGSITPELFSSEVVTIPTGAVIQWAGSLAPEGFLLCEGQPVLREAYDKLFKVIGTKYGEGNKTTTFELPDFRGRVPVGPDAGSGRLLGKNKLAESGGSASVALSVANLPAHTHTISGTTGASGTGVFVSGASSNAVKEQFDIEFNFMMRDTSGFESYEVVEASLNTTKSHKGFAANLNPHGHAHTISVTLGDPGHGHTFGATSTSVGSGTTHENTQPYLALNFVIKT